LLAIATLKIPEGLEIHCPYYTTTDKNNLKAEGGLPRSFGSGVILTIPCEFLKIKIRNYLTKENTIDKIN
jgi:hypothetical protein